MFLRVKLDLLAGRIIRRFNEYIAVLILIDRSKLLEFRIVTIVCVQLNCETNIVEKWLTHLVFGFGGRQSIPGSEARIPQ